jgi:amino acid adenylation domain-containing protein
MKESSAGRGSGHTIGERLAHVARSQPERTAIIEGDARWSFRALDNVATCVARALLRAARRPEARACLFFESKLAAIAAVFGAGRAGLPYVLLDAGDPVERLRFIARDCEPAVLLTETALIERARAIAPLECEVVEFEAARLHEPDAPLPAVAADAPVYLCYTSGSTGQPKGVVQTHRNLLFFADAYARALRIGAADRLSLLYTLSFNAANMDIFGGLLAGGTLCAYDLRRNGLAHVADWLDRERITVLHAVPTVFRGLLERLPADRLLPHLRAVDLGGEAVFGSDVELFRRHTLDGCVLVNQIASTEVGLIAQHVVTHATTCASEALVPVGRCPEGVRVEIRRDDGSPAGVDEPGQMIVCSAHVSPGYWRRPALDAAAFSPGSGDERVRCYASGDFGRIDADGNLHFLGRKGGRVKVHGHSVELMEVEAALAACTGVSEAAVVARPDAVPADTARLIAFVSMHRGAPPDALGLRRELAARAPSYMLPADIVFMDALPVTPSGKIDRSALTAGLPDRAATSRNVAAPQGDIEAFVAATFEELLDARPVGRDDDFFLLGGDSLRGMELQLRLRERFGVQVGGLHEDETVCRIASAIRAAQRAPSTSRAMPVLVPLWRQGNATPLFLIHGRHGQAFVSAHFMKLLGDDQPVWAFQARGLDGRDEPHATIEAMAEDYLHALRQVRPHGPYFLGALCAGAYVAAAMARALEDAGETVLPLLLLDPPERRNGGYTGMTEEQFMRKMLARRARGGSAGPTDDPGYMRRVLRAALAFERAIDARRTRPYGGDVYMLSSRQRTSGPDELSAIFTGKVERLVVGATHAEALDPRNPTFARELLRCVALIQQAGRPVPA